MRTSLRITLKHIVTCCSLIIAFCVAHDDVKAQEYYILGPEYLSCDEHLGVTYTLVGDSINAGVAEAFWTVTNVNGSTTGASIVSQWTLGAIVDFYTPGQYILSVNIVDSTGYQYYVEYVVFVDFFTTIPEIEGCYQYVSSADCYQVCAFSEMTIYFSGSQGTSVEVVGAQSYVYNPQFNFIEVVWGAGGPGYVSLDGGFCASRICFDILPQPVADFTTSFGAGDTITVCREQEVLFENLSYGGIDYHWDFGDGQQSDSYDAQHAFSEEGTYVVILTASSICDCVDEKRLIVQVLPEPAPQLDCINSICPESRQRYTATTDGCASYNWVVSANGTVVNGGGPADDFIEVIWHSGPDGFITLTVSSCNSSYCNASNTFRIPIISPESSIEGDASVCSGEIVTYSAPYFPGVEYNWQIGGQGTILDGANEQAVTVRWNLVNTITNTSVSVQYNSCFLECGGEATLPVTITPYLRLTGDVHVCQFGQAEATAEAGFSAFSAVPVNWHIEDAAGQIVYQHGSAVSTFTHVFPYPAGTYTWVATESSGSYCNEVVRMQIVVTEKPATPLAILGEREICPGVPYGYTVESAGDQYTTLWTVTDGSNTTQYQGQTFQHTFGAVPPYTVDAVHAHIQYPECVSDVVSITIEAAEDISIAGFGEVCFNSIDTFSARYVNGAEYLWEVVPSDHGEIRRSDLNHVEVFWSRTGPAILRLSACGIVVDKAVNVNALPPVNVLGPLAACANEVITLRTDQPALSHVWRNDNDNIVSFADTLATYPGAFAVEVTDGFGCMTEKAVQLDAYPTPVVHLSSPNDRFYCNQLPNGINIIANTDGVGYQFEWFRDNVSLGSGGPVFTVTDFGSYHVEVTNSHGCTTASQKVVFVNCCAPNTCSFPGNNPGCSYLQEDLMIDAGATTCNERNFSLLLPSIESGSVKWLVRSISKGVLAQTETDVLNYTYADPGYYQVYVFAELTGYPYTSTVCGHWDKMVDTVAAVANFKHQGICSASPITFEDLTTFLPGEVITDWAWDFGDPSSGSDNVSALQNPSHMYALGGQYEVTLSVTVASGCTTTLSRQITVLDGPVLNPQYENVYCENEALAFTLPGQLFDIAWDFDDPASNVENTAFADSVLHTYETPGMYSVRVAASDIYACRSEITIPVDIQPNTLSGVIDVDPGTVLCYGDTATLTSPAGGATWHWSSGAQTESIHVLESDQYSVLVRDANFCTYTPPAVFLEVNTTPEIFVQAREIIDVDVFGLWQDGLGICLGTEFEVQVFSNALVNYTWSTGATTPVLQFTGEAGNLPGAGVYTFYVVGTDQVTGCVSDTAFIEIEIFAPPANPNITLTAGSGCSFAPNTLTITNPQAGVTYTWSDGQTGLSITTEEKGGFYVIAENEYGCTSQSNTVQIKASPLVDQIPGGCHIACDPLTVCLPSLSPVSSYTIYQNGVVFETGTAWPQDFLITDDGSYTIEVTSPNGCTATSDPLDITLYTGTGTITVLTYEDADGDGVLSAGDVLLPGIPVQISSNDGMQQGMTYTEMNGQFDFRDYPAEGYIAWVDQSLLSSQWTVLIDSVAAQIATCDDSISVTLLLTQNCIAFGPDQSFDLCPGGQVVLGDSTWTEPGVYMMHLMSQSGCDSVFQVTLEAPDSLTINGFVWVDVDQDGALSPADTLVSGINVGILDPGSGTEDFYTTDISGSVSSVYAQGAYTVRIDTATLSAQYLPVIGSVAVSDTVCGSVDVQLLISSACPSVFVIEQYTICPGERIVVQGDTLSDEGQYTYVLSDSTTLCDTILDVYVLVSNDIDVVGTVDWSCVDLGSIELTVSGDGPFLIDWYEGLEGDTLVQNLDPGSYTVFITDSNGCTTVDTFVVSFGPVLSFSLIGEYSIEQGDSVWVTVEGDIDEPGLSFQWTPAGIAGCPTCPGTWFFPTSDTLIIVEITDADGCTYLLEAVILVDNGENLGDALFVPNVFSPNGDGANDHWRLYSKMETTHVHRLNLFDRWGNTVFTRDDFFLASFDGWDGTFNGTIMQPGVYLYTADVTLGDGRHVQVNGNVTLVR